MGKMVDGREEEGSGMNKWQLMVNQLIAKVNVIM